MHLNLDTSLASIAFADRDHGWVVGLHGALALTNDGGRSWQAQDVDTHEGLWISSSKGSQGARHE